MLTPHAQLPGTFVVLQGTPGDGLRNTMDRLPNYDVASDSETLANARSRSNADVSLVPEILTGSSRYHYVLPEHGTTTTSTTTTSTTTNAMMLVSPHLADILASNVVPPPSSLRKVRLSAVAKTEAIETRDMAMAVNPNDVQEHLSSDHSFVVVSDNIAEEDDADSSPPPPPSPDGIEQEAASRKMPRWTQELHNEQPLEETLQQQQQQQQQRTTPSADEIQALERWLADCRQQELLHRNEWNESLATSTTMATTTTTSAVQANPTWYMLDGQLAVLETLPQTIVGSLFFPQAVGALHPGTTVIGSQVVTLDSRTFNAVSATATKVAPRGRDGWIQFLKLESPAVGYVVYSLNGYYFLAPGLPSNFVDPEHWTWRVTCPVGAFVREGLDLSTKHIETIPYGSFVHVKRKTVNVMGLSRLQISATVEQLDGRIRHVNGWCSEFLNPLSGQRGSIVQPLAFAVPACYRVNLPEGAVIRSGVELSSLQIGHAPVGAVVVVTGRAFSEHPMDKCIERLRLAGNGGWISMRLNKNPPANLMVVECEGIDGRFEPDHPGMFHLNAIRRVYQEQENAQAESGRVSADLSSIDDDEGESLSASSSAQELGELVASCRPSCTYNATARNYTHQTSVSGTRVAPPSSADELCLVCNSEERNATIVHGETGHVACCLVCARMLKARGDPCLVCRLPIDSVIQQFWA